MSTGVGSDSGFWVNGVPVSLGDHVHAAVTAIGVAAVPSLGAGVTSAPFAVTLRPGMPSAAYTPYAVLVGSVTLLGGLSLISATVVDASTVNVVVKNTALVTLAGGSVLVFALS